MVRLWLCDEQQALAWLRCPFRCCGCGVLKRRWTYCCAGCYSCYREVQVESGNRPVSSVLLRCLALRNPREKTPADRSIVPAVVFSVSLAAKVCNRHVLKAVIALREDFSQWEASTDNSRQLSSSC